MTVEAAGTIRRPLSCWSTDERAWRQSADSGRLARYLEEVTAQSGGDAISVVQAA